MLAERERELALCLGVRRLQWLSAHADLVHELDATILIRHYVHLNSLQLCIQVLNHGQLVIRQDRVCHLVRIRTLERRHERLHQVGPDLLTLSALQRGIIEFPSVGLRTILQVITRYLAALL